MTLTDKQKDLLGYEEAHEDTTPEMYNEPSITDYGYGIAPKVRKGISAYCVLDNELYYLAEDDCHYWVESKVYSIDMLQDTLTNLKEYRAQEDYLTCTFFRNRQITVKYRKNTNSLLTVAMFNSIRIYDASWINQEIELLEEVISILKTESLT